MDRSVFVFQSGKDFPIELNSGNISGSLSFIKAFFLGKYGASKNAHTEFGHVYFTDATGSVNVIANRLFKRRFTGTVVLIPHSGKLRYRIRGLFPISHCQV